jgi:hypothetical protein
MEAQPWGRAVVWERAAATVDWRRRLAAVREAAMVRIMGSWWCGADDWVETRVSLLSAAMGSSASSLDAGARAEHGCDGIELMLGLRYE